MRIKRLTVFVGILSLLNSRQAFAQNPPEEDHEMMPSRVVLSVPVCVEALPTQPFLRILQAEFASDGVVHTELATTEGTNESGALARVSIEVPRCAQEASEFVITIDDRATGKSVRRTVDLSDIPSSTRVRALALAVAELLRASWLEISLPTAPVNGARIPEPVRNAVRLRMSSLVASTNSSTNARSTREVLRWSPLVGLEFDARVFLLTTTPLAGIRLVGGAATPFWQAGPRLRLRADAGVSFGTGSSPLGEADVLLATASAAVTFGRGTTIGFECGPRLETGLARAVGRLRTSTTVSGVMIQEQQAAIFSASLLFLLHGRFNAAVTGWILADLGWSFGGLDARSIDHATGIDVRVAGAWGPSLAIRLGIGWEP